MDRNDHRETHCEELRLRLEAVQRRRVQIRLRITRLEALRRELYDRMDPLAGGEETAPSAAAPGVATNPYLL